MADDLWNKRKRLEGLREKVRILKGARDNLFESDAAKADVQGKIDAAEAEIELIEGQIKELGG